MKLVYFTVEKQQTVHSKTIFYECIFTTPNQQIVRALCQCFCFIRMTSYIWLILLHIHTGIYCGY